MNEKREQAESLSQQKQRTEYELVQARAAVQSAQQKQHYAEQQLKQIAEQLESFESDKATLDEKLAAVTESLTSETDRLQTLTTELQEARQKIDQLQQSFRDGQLQLNQLNKEVEQNKSAVLDLMRKLSQVNSRLGAIEIERKNVAAQQQRLGDRRRIVMDEQAALEAKKTELQEKLNSALEAIAAEQAKMDAKKAESAALGKQISIVSERLGAAKENRSGLASREKLLKDLEAKREGVSEGVKSVLRQREAKFSFIRGLVADLLRVDVEHAHVIEAALDGRDQWLVTNDSQLAIAADENLNGLEGRVNVLCVDRLDANVPTHDWNQHPHLVRIAADLIKCDPLDQPIVQHLLGKTIIVDTLAIAGDLHQNAPAGFRYVTQQGDVLEADGTLRAGPLTAAMGLLSRRSELESVQQQITETDERIAVLTANLSEGNATARELEEQQNALRNAFYQANTTKVELTSAIAQNNDKQNSLKREQPVLDRELAALLDQVGRLKTEEDRLAEQKSAMETDQVNRQKAVEDLTARHLQLAEELKDSSETLTAARVQLGQVQEKQLTSQQEVQRQTAAKAELSQQIERIVKSADSIAGRRGSLQSELESGRQAEVALAEKQKTFTAQIEQLTSQCRKFLNRFGG